MNMSIDVIPTERLELFPLTQIQLVLGLSDLSKLENELGMFIATETRRQNDFWKS